MMILLIGLFFVVLAATTMAGIWWNSRSTSSVVVTGGSDGGPTMATALEWVGDRRPTQGSSGESARKLLSHAGYRQANASSILQGIKYVATVALAAIGFAAATFFEGDVLLGSIALGALGFFIPDKILKVMADRRRRILRAALPSAMDLMVLSIEAGQSLDMGLIETSRGIQNTFPALSAELNTLTGDLRANTSRADALRFFHERNGEPELKKIAALLSDTDRFGTSLGPALRNHSRYLRIRCKQQAQEAARKVGVKLIFPVFFLIFPSVILVTLGPALIMVSRQMKNYMSL